MKKLVLVAALFFPLISQAIPVAKFTSDQEIYQVNQRAILRVHLQTEPDNKNLEFYVIVKDQSLQEMKLDLIAPREFLGFTPIFSAPGSYTLTAETFLQDKRIAAALNAAIAFYNAEIARIDSELANTTDPLLIEALQAERQRNLEKRLAAQTELTRHRTRVDGTKSLTIQVQ